MELSRLDTDTVIVKHPQMPNGETSDITNAAEKDSPIQNTENNGHKDANEEDFTELDYWEDYEPVSGNVCSKHKNPTQRMKVKEHIIISNNKALTREPSYYGFHRSTILILQMLIEQRHIGELRNVIVKTKNSVVIYAHCHYYLRIYFISGNAVKVYKLCNSTEKNNLIYKQVQREYKYLEILRNKNFSNNTPHPVHMSKNVIVMSFIGSDQETAPSISTCILPFEKWNVMYYEIVKEIELWYGKCGIIHGNLSASKILYWTDRIHFIGWSHSVRKDHPMALKKLMRDCQFITMFFKSRGVAVRSVEDLFMAITNLDRISSKVLEMLHKDLWKKPDTTNPNRVDVSSRPIRDRFK